MPSPYLTTPLRTLREVCQGMVASGAGPASSICRGCNLRPLCVRIELRMRGNALAHRTTGRSTRRPAVVGALKIVGSRRGDALPILDERQRTILRRVRP